MTHADRSEWSRSWHDPQLGLRLLQAHHINHAYPPHSHDYYVVCIIDRGRQSFTHERRRYVTPPGGIILINPGEVHTGEAAAAGGFVMRCLYPTVAQVQAAVADLYGRHQALPAFRQVRVDDHTAHTRIAQAHAALVGEAHPLERETRLAAALAHLVEHYEDVRAAPYGPRPERTAVEKARRLIDERYAEGLSLSELAAHTALSPYYLVRVFRAAYGLPPHAYLDNVRIRHAERLIAAGKPLAMVAAETGYSSQSHLTRRFRQIIGVTPGQYARHARA
jgi:AraC-like DNA-binding protein